MQPWLGKVRRQPIILAGGSPRQRRTRFASQQLESPAELWLVINDARQHPVSAPRPRLGGVPGDAGLMGAGSASGLAVLQPPVRQWPGRGRRPLRELQDRLRSSWRRHTLLDALHPG